MLGGAISCGLTHAAITPLDVAKCNMQVSLPNTAMLSATYATYFRSTPQNTRALSLV